MLYLEDPKTWKHVPKISKIFNLNCKGQSATSPPPLKKKAFKYFQSEPTESSKVTEDHPWFTWHNEQEPEGIQALAHSF